MSSSKVLDGTKRIKRKTPGFKFDIQVGAHPFKKNEPAWNDDYYIRVLKNEYMFSFDKTMDHFLVQFPEVIELQIFDLATSAQNPVIIMRRTSETVEKARKLYEQVLLNIMGWARTNDLSGKRATK